jgi:probable phosphoglycerate mutase
MTAPGDELPQVFLARHGETEWSASGRHTGRTDLPLTAQGERAARLLAPRLERVGFGRVFTSPRLRARRTAELAGFGAAATIDPDLAEWDYGADEGRRTVEIQAERPGWNLFRDGCSGGESPADVSARADRVVARLRALAEARILLFGHGHFSRALAARWLGFPIESAAHLSLSTASLSTLGYERSLEMPALRLWNDTET